MLPKESLFSTTQYTVLFQIHEHHVIKRTSRGYLENSIFKHRWQVELHRSTKLIHFI